MRVFIVLRPTPRRAGSCFAPRLRPFPPDQADHEIDLGGEARVGGKVSDRLSVLLQRMVGPRTAGEESLPCRAGACGSGRWTPPAPSVVIWLGEAHTASG